MMGGAVSSGESNDDLIDNLRGADYIKTPLVERVFRAVDRAFYYTKPYKQNAYKDIAWKDGNLHLSAPCIYSEVMENLQLESGMAFLNIGSGTGYLSTLAGLILGHKGSNHGIELAPDVIQYARAKLQVFLQTSSAVDLFDFLEPQFVVGNCLEILPTPHRYDRIYCGAACENADLECIIDLLKLGGICVLPMSDSLVKITRVSESRVEMKTLLPVSFTTLVPSTNSGKKQVHLPEWNPPKLSELCRAEIRQILRGTLETGKPDNLYVEADEECRKKRRKKRNDRRRANRLLLVQHRRNRSARAQRNQNGLDTCSSTSQTNSDDDVCVQQPRTAAVHIVNHPPEATSSTAVLDTVTNHESMTTAPPSSEPVITVEQNETVDLERQAAHGRSSMILGRIRDLVRNRQLERQNMQAMQAQRELELQREIEEALREPLEAELNWVPEVAGAPGNDDDEVDNECVWTSNESSSTSTSSSSTSSSSSDESLMFGEDEQEQSGAGNVREQEEVLSDARTDGVGTAARRSPLLGFTGLTFSPLKTNTTDENDGVKLSNAQIETESIEEGNNQDPPQVLHPFSIQMIEKINLLPLPPAMKKYLNYHRNMQ